MANDNLEIARRVFRAFDPRPLKSSKQNLYVNDSEWYGLNPVIAELDWSCE